MSLADALEAAAEALPADEEAIRPANGDPHRLLAALDAEGRRRVLGWLLAERPEEASELAADWIEEPEGAAAVAGLAEAELPKAGRKALRRLRHRLRSRGVELPEAEAAPAPRVATIPSVEEAVGGAWLSPLDPMGSRIAYLVEPHPQGGVRLFEVIFRESARIEGVEIYAAGRGKVRRFLAGLSERGTLAPVEVEPDALRALLARAASEHPPDRSLPQGFREWRSHLASPAEGARTPGEAVRAELGEEGAPERAAELVREGAIGPWPDDEARLREAGERLRESAEGRVIVSGARRAERLDALLAEAVESVFDDAASRRTVHRLRESAFHLWRGGGEADARACLAAAAELERGAPGASGVARALVERPLEPVLRSLREGGEGAASEEGGERDESEGEEGSLLVKP